MAIIYSYPKKTTPNSGDLLVITDSTQTAPNKNRTKNLTLGNLAVYVINTRGNIIGTGTPDTISVFKTASEVYTPVNTTAIAGKSFLQKISQTNATIELGASTSFTDLNEGLKIYPNTTHFTTRVTPWLEIFAYEDPSANPLNSYNTAYDGSALIVGKSNNIGDANSSNLAIVGFNNTLIGNKMMVVGQTNSINGTNNTGSLVVGVSNNIASAGTIKNSLIAGQNLGTAIAATIDASFITGRGNAAQGNISRSIVGGDNNDANNVENSFISGVRNEIINGSNSTIVGGQNNTIGNVNSTSANNNFVAGENNNLGILSGSTSNKDSFILGRGNRVEGLIGGALGSGNVVYSDVSSAGTSCAIGQNNSVGSASSRVRNAIAIGTQNNLDNDYEIQIGRGLDSVTTSGNNHVLIGRNNDQNTDYDLSSINCSLVVGASTLPAAASRRNGLVITNKTGGSNEGNVILPTVGKYRNYTDEAAAKAGGVPLYGLYHTNGVVHIVYTP